MTSSTLLEVTVLYKLQQYDQCIDILNLLELELNRKQLFFCVCDIRREKYYNKINKKKFIELSVSSTMKETSTCLIFLPSNRAIVPDALQYEFDRSVNAPLEYTSDSYAYDIWYGLAIVDAVVYLYFIKYLISANRNQLMNKHVAINKLESVLKCESNLGHRETGYNLLGWIHFREG